MAPEVELAGALPAAFAGEEEALDPFSERILAAARRQLMERGLRRTSLDDIATDAGVARATLFRRFPSRDALMTALAAREARGAIARVDARIAELEDPADRLVEAALGVIDQLSGNGLLQRLLATDPEQVLPLLTTRGGPILELGRRYIADQLEELEGLGAELPGERDILAELLARVTLSLAVNREGVLPLDDPEAMSTAVRQLTAPMMGTRP